MINGMKTGILLSSGNYRFDRYSRWEMIAGLGVEESITIPFGNTSADVFERMQSFIDKKKGWCFFLISYDLKNSIERLSSSNPDRIGFPELVIFRPKAIAGARNGKLIFEGDKSLLDELLEGSTSGCRAAGETRTQLPAMRIQRGITKEQYLGAIHSIMHHIKRGDIYELNFCHEFFGDLCREFDPVSLWGRLSSASPAPFSVFCRWWDHLLVSASPERFLQRKGCNIISQPMKGTVRRGNSPAEDEELKARLNSDLKERSENVMITDLVRNDLSRVALKATVKVEELFGIYTFPKVHQMISTVSAELPPELKLSDLLRATFPMGSMTGAPKIRAMELIEEFESCRRGIFSGTVGYIDPNGDLDMNVIIRSIICNLERSVVSFQTGGAITFASEAEAEYAEAMLKAKALLEALNAKSF